MIFKLQNLKCSEVASIILNNDLEKSARNIYLLVLSKDLTLFNYMRVTLELCSWKIPSTLLGKMQESWTIKLYLHNGLRCLWTNIWLWSYPAACYQFTCFTGCYFFFNGGAIKFNTLSKWFNPYCLEYDGILIKSHFQVFQVKCFSKHPSKGHFLLININALAYFSGHWAFFSPSDYIELVVLSDQSFLISH